MDTPVEPSSEREVYVLDGEPRECDAATPRLSAARSRSIVRSVLFVAACVVALLWPGRLALAVTLDDGDILVADAPAQAIIRVNPSTGAQTILSSGGSLVAPFSVVQGRDGRIYVTDVECCPSQGAVLRIDPITGAQTVVATAQTQFHSPVALAALPDGRLVVSTVDDPGLVVIDPALPNGSNLSFLPLSELGWQPRGVAVDQLGRIRFTGRTPTLPQTHTAIIGFESSGPPNYVVASQGGLFQELRGIVLLSTSGLVTGAVVADARCCGGNGGLIFVDLTSGQQATLSSGGFFVQPHGLTIAPDGSYLVADRDALGSTGAVIRVDPLNGAQTVVSAGVFFNDPSGITVYRNRAPELTLGAGSVGYLEDTAGVVLAPAATLTDDSGDFGGGQLKVALSANGTADDRLEIQQQGSGAGQISVAGSTVSYGGVSIGTAAGGASGVPLTVSLTSSASQAAVQTLVRAITFRVASDEPSTATRSVQFTVDDGRGGSSTSAPVTRLVAVGATNDPPVNTVPGDQKTPQDTPLVFSKATTNAINVSDPDAGRAKIQATLTVKAGTLTLKPPSGQPQSGVTGNGTGTLTLDGTVGAITSDLEGLVYSPKTGFSGLDSLTLQTNDLGNTGEGGPLTTTSTVQITVTPGNRAPTANPDGYTVPPNGVTTIVAPGVLANDTDPDAGTKLTAELVTSTASGTLTLQADGAFTYTPKPGFTGLDGFSYRASDGTLVSPAANVELTVSGPAVAVKDGDLLEGASGSTTLKFQVTLTQQSTQTVTVQYATVDGTARVGSDYLAASGTLTFKPGETAQPIEVTILGDTVVEADEAFTVRLSNPVNATLSVSQATGTISNDDVVVACAPRPRVTPTLTPGSGGVQVRIESTQLNTQVPNPLQQLRFGTIQNATVRYNGQIVSSGQTISLPGNTTTADFFIRRIAPMQPLTVPVTIVDVCGEWTTFVGGGIGADF